MRSSVARHAPVVSLAALAAGLGALIVFECSDVPDALPPTQIQATAATALPERAALPLSEPQLAERAGTILARPLFTPGRRPPPANGPIDETMPRLTGIIVTPEGRFAMFAGPRKAILVGEGSHIQGQLVSKIEPDFVTLVGPAGPHLLHTKFSNDARPRPTGPGAATAPSVAAADTARAAPR